ncbi:SCO family protein [Ilyomonas limi]|uniref:SCO family protein n=1 Tax=Ilyomonas limi TaxID=2575867 RepID=A0A4U3KZT3_9BACT|nr:SCO family protein [Ilyomonas limi]TKK68060.1 SCO family protein [Ilyomonas limi]
MRRTTILALCIALLIPIIGYLLAKYASEHSIDMPRHYLPDSVVNRVEDGKMMQDTVWHTVANIRLQNQFGDTVSLYDIQNKMIVADFFFTSCAGICPTLTKNMAKLQRSFARGGDQYHRIDTSIVQFVSFTIDPERDSASRLKAYADHFGVNHDNWWFLTGNRDSIYNFIFEQLRVDKYSNEPIDSNFVHTNRFVLIDKMHKVRGYYDGTDSAALGKLAHDIGILMVEKATNPEPLPFDPVLMAIFFAVTIVVVVIAIRLLFRKNRINP